jgi:hypothetical protein
MLLELDFWRLARDRFRSRSRAAFRSICLDVPRMAERLRCYEICIGMDGLVYQAYAGHWKNLEWTARRLRQVLSAE